MYTINKEASLAETIIFYHSNIKCTFFHTKPKEGENLSHPPIKFYPLETS